MKDIFEKFNIDSYAFIPAEKCRAANLRLYENTKKDANVIFMLFPYYAGNCNGKLSAYACVYDYHAFAKELFAALEARFASLFPEKEAKCYCDHSPFLEGEGAAMAGLGILGRHSLLITEKYSSFVFIGEMVTTATREELISVGIPEGDGILRYCEDCGACRRACPAADMECAVEAHRDSCASAISQKKGELSEKETALLKKVGSAWGCDICQLACPHTKKALLSGSILSPLPFFQASYLGEKPFEKITAMDGDTFSLYPFAWRKRAPITRNIDILTSTPATHQMKLAPKPFEMIKSGQKTVELRLWDEKRKKIKRGDIIIFTSTESGETICAKVCELYIFESFEKLYASLPLLKCGYTKETVKDAHPSHMEQYYSAEEERRCGVVGIELILLTEEGRPDK